MTTRFYDFSNDSKDWCTHTINCFHCGETNIIQLDFMSYMRWYNGDGLIQDIWPNLDADQRELIMTGTHPDCWNAMFS